MCEIDDCIGHPAIPMWEKWSRGSNVNTEGLVISALFEVEPDVFKTISFEPIFTKLRLFLSLVLSPW